MFDRQQFDLEKQQQISEARADNNLINEGLDFLAHADKYKYGYNWSFLGLPVIQMPEDIVITQEILWKTKPKFVIEAGIAWGGSLAIYAAFQEIVGHGKTFGIDVTIPQHNRAAILDIPVGHRIELIEGSSTDPEVFDYISSQIGDNDDVLVVLDSNHTHEHVLKELNIWSRILKPGNFMIISDTVVEHIPKQVERPRPWGPGNNPGTALNEFLEQNMSFTQDNEYNKKAFTTFNPGGYVMKSYI